MTHPATQAEERRPTVSGNSPFSYSYLVLTILMLLTIGATIAYHRNAAMFDPSDVGWTPVVFLIGLSISFLIFGLTHRDTLVRRELEKKTRDLISAQKQNETLLEAEQNSRRAAEDANRAKDEFLALVSHELKTPLHAITGWNRVLKTPDLTKDDRNRAIQKIEKNLHHQASMIDELLNFSEVMSGSLTVIAKPIVARDVFEEAVIQASSAAGQKGVTLLNENSLDGERVLGDKSRLKLAITNVIANAVKFTPTGGSVEAKACVVDNLVKCIVTDTGSGIPPEFLPHIFEQYSQSERPTTRRYGGLGLGLTIADRIVRLHHGKIEAKSSGVGRGATFTISLPIRD